MKTIKECLDLMREMGESLYTDEDKRRIFENAYCNSFINGSILEEEKADNEESQRVKQMILSNQYWIRNDYEGFYPKPFQINKTAVPFKIYARRTARSRRADIPTERL